MNSDLGDHAMHWALEQALFAKRCCFSTLTTLRLAVKLHCTLSSTKNILNGCFTISSFIPIYIVLKCFNPGFSALA